MVIKLHSLILQTKLVSTIKWKTLCYTLNNQNVLIIGEFKSHLVLSFLQGALLIDNNKELQKPGENTQAGRILKFQSVNEILEKEALINNFIQQAIALEEQGLKYEYKKPNEIEFVPELLSKLSEIPALKKAFFALTPGRQRAYNMHFEQAKQAKTREARIEKNIPLILSGKGINDCTCGLSKKMPYCDGSHKILKVNT